MSRFYIKSVGGGIFQMLQKLNKFQLLYSFIVKYTKAVVKYFNMLHGGVPNLSTVCFNENRFNAAQIYQDIASI